MAKDFTDYVALILEAEKRVYHIYHLRANKTSEMETIPHNKREYVFDRDRAFRVKWKPWPVIDWSKPVWAIPGYFVNELIRSKKVGLLLYHEPLPSGPKYREVAHKVPKDYTCKTCGFVTKHQNGIKVHMRSRHKLKDYGPQIKVAFDVTVEKVPYFDPILPIHISRMHQPSGVLK